MAISLIANTSISNGGLATGDSPAIDTTGANLLVMVLSFAGVMPSHDPTPSDSKGNTWTPLTRRETATIQLAQRMYYVSNPTVGAGHTFSAASDVTEYPSICVAAFSGVAAFDQETGATSYSASSLASGPLTPSGDGALVVSGFSWDGVTGSASVDSDFSITDQEQYSAGNHEAAALAYKVQSTAAAENVTWTAPASEQVIVSLQSFAEGTPDTATITSDCPLEEAEANAPYSVSLTATGCGSLTWSVISGALPPGLTLNPTTGEISGTPTTPGHYDFQVRADCS